MSSLLLVTAMTMPSACREPPTDATATDASPRASDSTPPPEVEIAGCQATRREPLTCSLRVEKTDLNLWIAAREAPIVEVDGAPASASLRPSIGEAGWTVALEVPRTARELSVRLGPDGTPWTIALEATEPTPIVEAVETELIGKPFDAAAYQRGLARLDEQLPQMSIYERIAAGRARMRILQQLGDIERAIATGDETLELALERDLPSEAIYLSQVLVYLRSYRRDSTEVQLQLDLQSWYLPRVVDAAQRTRWHYYRGVRAFAAGELRSAVDELQSAERDARKLGLTADELAAASMRAPLLGLVGRRVELSELVDRILVLTIEGPVTGRCRDANNLSNAGWGVLLARTRGPGDDTAATLFERALAFYGPNGGCDVADNPESIVNLQEARINYTLEALMRSDWAAAATRADAVDMDAIDAGQRRWLDYIRGELALQHSDARAALVATRRIDERDDLRLKWRVAVLEGRALEALGRERDALKAYLRAEAILDQAVERLGVDQGREGLIAGMNSSASHVIRLQLAGGDVAAAAESARRSRTRAMRRIGRSAVLARLPAAQRERWQSAVARYETLSRSVARELTDLWRLPQDERDQALRRHAEVRREMRIELDTAFDAMSTPALSQPPRTRPLPGEVWLLYHPNGDAWFGFAMTAAGETAATLPPAREHDSLADIASRLLDPFASAIEEARSLDVLAMGELDDVAFHVLPWQGEPLVVAKPIGYRLDLGVPPPALRPTAGRVALVVADPASRRPGLGRLPSALAEGELVGRSFREAGWSVTVLAGEEAIHDNVVAGLARADWLHYAGHGFSTTGWDSALPLSGEAELDVRSVIALPRVPGAIVLSGCRTGTIEGRSDVGGQHLAAAFLLAGSRFVIATSADVEDAAAMEAAGSLYAALREDEHLEGPQLLRRAMLQSQEVGRPGKPDAWQHYRAWVP